MKRNGKTESKIGRIRLTFIKVGNYTSREKS